jgi:hypothetical protein
LKPSNLLLFLLLSMSGMKGNAQAIPTPKIVTLAPGPQFTASKWKEFWWGKHWRNEWLTPVSFPVIDMDTTAGGLTILKRGGGHETKTLRLKGGDGREYVLRTVDKSLDVLVPEDFKGSFINDLVNDQVSTAHPFGPIVVARLSSSIGILHTNPVITFVPDNDRLGEFKSDFANKLCLFEERPSGDGWENSAITGYAKDIINSEKLSSKLLDDNKKQIDQKAFLKVRLLDMLINDWDRHEDQWLWASHKQGGKTIYQPFARDRDQAFSKTDGVSLFLISRPWALRTVQNLGKTVHDVIGSNLSANSLDRQFTIALSEDDWRQTILSLQQSLTDSIIHEALRQMPDTIYLQSGDFLYNRLRSRRDDMLRYGMKYYKILTRSVSIKGTNEKEIFTIQKPDRRTTEITVQSVNKQQQPSDTIYHRIFNKQSTKELFLYGMDGNDAFNYTGNKKNKIKLRAFPDTNTVKYNPKAFKYDWYMPLIIPGYNPDDGILIGAGFTYKKQLWGKKPFGWQQTIGGSYAAATGAYNVFYKGLFKQVFGRWDYKAPSFVVNFYGYGNDTKLGNNDKNFYRTRATSFLFNPAASRTWRNNEFNAGLIYNSVKVEVPDNKFINQPIPGIDSSIFQTKYFTGANAAYTFNNADNPKNPTRGIRIHGSASYIRNLKEGNRDFAHLTSNFSFYYSPFKNIILAHRTGAATNIGDYEFYQANTLGGQENLRGYWRTRFTGRSSFYQNTDIRWKIADLKGYVLRGTLGVYGFLDDGRVWIKEESSDELHTGYGGGVYFIPYNRLAINLSYASSREVNVFTFRTGFLF